MAHVDYFLKIDGIKGESQDKAHKDEIHVSSFSFGMAQQGASATDGGGGAGKVEFHDIACTATVGNHSALLQQYCASGKHIAKIVLTSRKAGEKPVDYQTITLTNSIISSYHMGGSPGETVPAEQFAINFAKIEYSYAPQKSDGSLDAAQKMGYDLKANSVI